MTPLESWAAYTIELLKQMALGDFHDKDYDEVEDYFDRLIKQGEKGEKLLNEAGISLPEAGKR